MKFSRLRLSGFKSFVEPSELVIEQGLTGVVGPNGCGKSNLLEAMRWVMGESSYKNMRASGMDDVIFSGTSKRPARNIAEVVLSLENTAGDAAPAGYEGVENVEISRRIERESGSSYRINGKDARARDVQLFFADTSTGARSPALVRQGQIGEIINAKPQARRRILEEAAGITGLYTRRHEAELKLNAAQSNLTRFEDVVSQLEAQLQSLTRQARQASRYKSLSADIRQMEASTLYITWRDAGESLAEEQSKLDEVTRLLASFTTAVAEKTRHREAAAETLPSLRENETVRNAVLQKLTIEKDGLERDQQQAETRRHELSARLQQGEADLAHEQEILADADEVLARLMAEQQDLQTAHNGDAEARDKAARHMQQSADELAVHQQNLDAQAAELSRMSAERQALSHTIADLQNRLSRSGQELQKVAAKCQEIDEKINTDSQIDALKDAVEKATSAARNAEIVANESVEQLRQLRDEESKARSHYDNERRQADNLSTQMATLSDILNVADGDLWPPLIDALKVEPGYETALAAALGDDIDASADEAAPAHWKSLPALPEPAKLPSGSASLADFVKAPAALARRLTHVGVVDVEAGHKLQSELRPGQRLVSAQGDLWRWDGFSAAADAPTAAAKRLAERNRLGDLQQASKQATKAANAARNIYEAARQKSEQAEADQRSTTENWRQANRAVEDAQRLLSNQEQAMAGTMREASALAEAARRLKADEEDVKNQLANRQSEFDALPELESLTNSFDALRGHLEQARDQFSEARARHDGLEREARSRVTRLEAIATERQQWQQRVEKAKAQVKALSERSVLAQKEISELADIPRQIEDKRQKMLSALAVAETERNEASDKLAQAENALRDCDALLRSAETELSGAREERARLAERTEAMRQRRQEAERRIIAALECRPDEIASKIEIDVDNLPVPAVLEERLGRLREQRERLGTVNLRAEQEVEEVSEKLQELTAERQDLEQAIGKLRHAINSLNREGRQRLLTAFETVNSNFSILFSELFGGGHAELKLIESDDPLEAGLELLANPPGKTPQVLSLLSGGEQTLTAMALIFAVFLTNPSPICVLDEVDAPLDDHNVERFCNLLDAMLERTETRFLIITHHPMTMARMHRLFGVTMMERGVSQLVSVNLETAESLRETG